MAETFPAPNREHGGHHDDRPRCRHRTFVEHRELLFAIVYDMLGSVADTEDVLQETWLGWVAVDHDRVDHPRARRSRYRVDARVQQRVTERFVEAAMGGDLEALLRVLAPDVTLWTDGGGKGVATSPHPVHGREAVANLLVGVTANAAATFDIRYRHVNGDPSAVLFSGESPFAVLVLDLTPAGDRVLGIYSVTNPDKLTRIPR